MRLKAGGKHQRLRVVHFRSFLIVMREEGSKVGYNRKFFYEKPEKTHRLQIKHQERTVIAIIFVCARS
jgi:hypothetical protein